MELFRVSRDAWGREMLQGMSWDLLWVFFGAGAALILAHALYRAFLARRPEER
jgi:formate dehydrogenase subunit gamma